MKKLVISFLLSFMLIAGTQGQYSFAQTDELAQTGYTLKQNVSCEDNHQFKLEQKAKAMGITVDELKTKIKAEHQVKLEAKAKEMGITVDELKTKIKAEHS